ncbi:lipoate--protein ligase [Mycoplasmatota bacterium]|nr:lipoate--protein ligase [Mycoplasmatota bacterium]
MILIRHHNEGNLKPYFYFALEEYLLNEVLKEGETYFFTWEIHGVVVGKNQVIENEVNLEFLKENKIDIYRRPTGGGCVYADHRNTMFSIVTKRTNKQFSFKKYLQKIIDALNVLDVELTFSGRNDLLFDGKKISGNAFLQNKNGMLMHGTFLYDCDLETMVRAISPSDEKLVSKGISSVKSRVTNLKPYLNGMSQEELIKHFENVLTTETYELSDKEIEKINLMASKYASKDWIYQVQPPYTKMLKKRIGGGLFEIIIDLKHGKINHLQIKGDFFDTKSLETFESKFKNILFNHKEISKILQNNHISNYVLDVDEQAFNELLLSGTLL